MIRPSVIAGRVCARVARGENVVKAINSLGLELMPTLKLMAGFEGELMSAHDLVKRRMTVQSNNPELCPPDAKEDLYA